MLSGNGPAFCAGYDLTYYAQATGTNDITQEMPWDPMQDYKFMMRNTELFMSLWRSYNAGDPQGARLCGGRRLRHRAVLRHHLHGRGCAHRLHADPRLGLPDDGDVGLSAGRGEGQAHAVHRRQDHRRRGGRSWAWCYKAVPADKLDEEVEALAERMAGVPQNQLMMQKLMINQAYDNMGLQNTQMIATMFDGITRHSPEGLNFKRRAEETRLEGGGRGARPRHLRLDRATGRSRRTGSSRFYLIVTVIFAETTGGSNG